MWKGKSNCVCGGQLEWLDNYAGHLERLRKIKPLTKFTRPLTPSYATHRAKQENMKQSN